jgi:hypothetical protein
VVWWSAIFIISTPSICRRWSPGTFIFETEP